MPSILFHELVGYKIASKYKKYDTNNFYLGLMVPDSVNAYGFASKENRWRTHRRDKNLDIWQENVIKFYKENKGKFEETYLAGYVIHILTDIICDRIYQNKLYPKLLEEGYDYNTAYSHYEKGIEKFENSNINENWWKYVKEKFLNGNIEPICGMDKQMILDEVRYTVNKYENRVYEECGFIGDDFAKEVVEEIVGVSVIKI